jgi:hypothetical protein
MKEVRDSIKERSAVLRSDLASTDAAVKKYMLESTCAISKATSCNFT